MKFLVLLLTDKSGKTLAAYGARSISVIVIVIVIAVGGWSRPSSHLDCCGGHFKFSGHEPGAASIRSSDVS